MRPNKPSIDGFRPRRPTGQAINSSYRSAPAATGATGLMQRRGQVSVRDESAQTPVLTRSGQGLTRQEVDESLNSLNNVVPPKRKLRRGIDTKPVSRKKRIAKWAAILIATILLAIAGYFVYKTLHAGGNVFKSGNILSLFQNQPLKQDANGRSNILILGTSEDDPGHDAGYLTDSILVLSIDQKNKTAAMFSIPRDLEVKYGMGCASGYSGKINVYFSCVNSGTDAAAEQDRMTKTQQFMGDIVGLDIQYGVHVNYTVMRDVVKAIGNSITVNIEGSGGAPGVMDSNFDWKCWNGARSYPGLATIKRNCPPNGHFIDYPNGPANLDAEHALYLAQARGDVMPTYGLGNSNFDRERNQQKIMLAIREKALSAGTLTDFGKVSNLIDALDKNLRTNFDMSEIRTLAQLGTEIKNDAITRIDLFDQSKGTAVFTANAQPSAGAYQYDQLRAYIRKQLSADPVAREGANVMVLNGTSTAGVAQTEADKLDKLGMTITRVANAPSGSYGKATIYQVGTGMSASKAKLESLYGTTVTTETPPVTVTGETNFVVIIGEAPATNSTSDTATTSQ